MRTTPRGLADLEALEQVFGALAHATRRHVLVVLRARGGKMSAGAIAARFSCAWPTVTRHLRILLRSGLVKRERRGRERLYALDMKRLHAVVHNWLGWFENPHFSRRQA